MLSSDREAYCRGSKAGALFVVGPGIRMKTMDTLKIAGREFRSRLFVGTGKYRSFPEMARCHEASGAEVVTVAVRRVDLADHSKESLMS
jgi:thiazole synthase ThiGH ThiG subunit